MTHEHFLKHHLQIAAMLVCQWKLDITMFKNSTMQSSSAQSIEEQSNCGHLVGWILHILAFLLFHTHKTLLQYRRMCKYSMSSSPGHHVSILFSLPQAEKDSVHCQNDQWVILFPLQQCVQQERSFSVLVKYFFLIHAIYALLCEKKIWIILIIYIFTSKLGWVTGAFAVLYPLLND